MLVAHHARRKPALDAAESRRRDLSPGFLVQRRLKPLHDARRASLEQLLHRVEVYAHLARRHRRRCLVCLARIFEPEQQQPPLLVGRLEPAAASGCQVKARQEQK